MEPIPDQNLDPQEWRPICVHCERPCEEGDMFCMGCADLHNVCMVCGEKLERMTREDYTCPPTCPEHN